MLNEITTPVQGSKTAFAEAYPSVFVNEITTPVQGSKTMTVFKCPSTAE